MRPLDLVVVGLGAAGSATLFQAARRGARVLGIDRHRPPHEQGSSHGESRITRQAIGEGLDYVPLALRAHELWREIEAETGEALFVQTGALMIAPPGLGAAHHGIAGFFERTLEAARAFDIVHETLTAAEVRRRWPHFRVSEAEGAYFEPGAGLVRPEAAIAAQLRLATGLGAEIRTGETVLAVDPVVGGVRVTTEQGAYVAARAVVCAGAWIPVLVGESWADRLSLYRQAMHWFEPAEPAVFAPDRTPVFIWMYGEGEGDWFYGFPRDPALGGVKIASEQWSQTATTPEAIDRVVTRDEALALHARHVDGRIKGLPARWLRSRACLYTCAPQSRFMIGEEGPGVIVVSACSGHGFKHSPAIGEAVAAWALSGERPDVLAPFDLVAI